MSDVAGAWQRIETWLRDNAPETYRTLNPPATDAAIAHVEELIGVPLPADVAASLRVHDGVTADYGCFAIAGRYAPASVERIESLWRMLTELLLDQFADDEGMLGWWWHPQWVPIAEDNAACQLIVDGRAGEDNDRVTIKDREGGPYWDIADSCWPSLGALLLDTADLLEGRKVQQYRDPTVQAGLLFWN